jgi:hypothetical protein
LNLKRILLWFLFPYVMVFVEWRKANILLKVYGSFSAGVILLMIIVAITQNSEQPTSEVKKDQKAMKKVEQKIDAPLYPDDVIDTIEKLKEPGMSKVDKYSLFEQKLIGLIPTEKEMEQHKKIVLDAYKVLSFEGINKLDDDILLKQIYSARMVDRYFSFEEVSNPAGLFAFNYIQIAKDAYRDILEKENYEINKSTMDKHFNNM